MRTGSGNRPPPSPSYRHASLPAPLPAGRPRHDRMRWRRRRDPVTGPSDGHRPSRRRVRRAAVDGRPPPAARSVRFPARCRWTLDRPAVVGHQRRPGREVRPRSWRPSPTSPSARASTPRAITVVSTDEVTWRDGSIGCPEPGMNYTQALVPGVRVVLELDGVRYEYHAGGAARSSCARTRSARRGLIGAALAGHRRRHAAATARRRRRDAPPPPTLAVDSLPGGDRHDAAPTPPADASMGGPTFRAGAIVAPAGDRPWLLVGTGRAAPASRPALTVFASPDGTAWAPIDAEAADHTARAAAYGRADGSVIIAGAVDRADGSHPAVWQLRDGALAVTRGPRRRARRGDRRRPRRRGWPMLLLATPDGPAVASAADGGWSTVLLPGGGEAAASGSARRRSSSPGTSIWRSTDGARSSRRRQPRPCSAP